jgi:hypothetical protein
MSSLELLRSGDAAACGRPIDRPAADWDCGLVRAAVLRWGEGHDEGTARAPPLVPFIPSSALMLDGRGARARPTEKTCSHDRRGGNGSPDADIRGLAL